MAGSASKKRTVSEIMKRDKAEEVEKKSKEIASWIEGTLNEKLPKPNLRESLLDGVILCKLINVLAPNSLKRFHKKPRMLAMKIENIGFFLATCKTRMNLPQALLFQPTDIHDDSNNLASMSKVLNVLSFLKGDSESEMIQELPPDDDEEDDPNNPNGAKPEDAEDEPVPDPDEHDIAPPEEPYVPPPVHSTPVVEPAPVVQPSRTSATVAPTNTTSSSSTSSAGGDGVQNDILKAVLDVINAELSVDSKRKLVKHLEAQLQAFNEKLLHLSDDQLVAFAKDVGVDDVPKKGREAIVDAVIKQGRIQ